MLILVGQLFSDPDEPFVDLTPGATTAWYYDTDTETSSMIVTGGDFGNVIPTPGTVLFASCDGADLTEFIYDSGFYLDNFNPDPAQIVINRVTLEDDFTCCSVNPADFAIETTGDDGSSNGTIKITSETVDVDLYEASLNGVDFTAGSGGQINLTGLATGSHPVYIRQTGGACFATISVFIADTSESFPFAMDITEPSQFMPVFYPISFIAQFTGNSIDVKQNGINTVVETTDPVLFAYLQANPRIRIYGSVNYNGVYDLIYLNSTQFIIQATYAGDQSVSFTPADRQVFYLFCERDFNVFEKIAEIASASDANGVYNIRVEGFLQSEFELHPPVEGDEITLGRKYYLQARDFSSSSEILTAVYSAIESLANFLEDLVPLGPAPINFINEQTQKGLPVLFSYLNQVTGRVVNIISSKETSIVTTNDINISALPCNEYDVQWIKTTGNINGALQTDTPLPSWITAEVNVDRVLLTINTCAGQGGDYTPEDYLSEDYLTAGFNELVGCYEFTFSDDDGELFTLSICVYPIQQPVTEVCQDNAYNIAWINREGGWSSYAFASDGKDKSKKILGVNVGGSTDYKRDSELKKSSITDVFNTAQVLYSLKNQRELRFIASLRYSIQAYLFNDVTKQWDIPIYLNIEDIPLESVPFNQATDGNGSFTFRYSDEIRIQRQ